jgi:chemotaxis signal transduction protein
LNKSAQNKRGNVTTIGDSRLVFGMNSKKLPKIIKVKNEHTIIVIHKKILKAAGAAL